MMENMEKVKDEAYKATKEILEKAGVSLIDYSLFKINDKVEVIKPDYTYETYEEFFDENNIPALYKENYIIDNYGAQKLVNV